MSIFAYKQVVDVGNQFGGAAPDGAVTDENGVQTTAWGTQAGLWVMPRLVAPYSLIIVKNFIFSDFEISIL